MANIRNQDAWVHSSNPDMATEKAKDMVRMATAKAFFSQPLQETDLPINSAALVVGGGIAGMTAALSLARQGCPVHLVEKSDHLGGNACRLNTTFRDENIDSYLKEVIASVMENPLISLHFGASVEKVDGFVGNFTSIISNGSPQESIDHGVTIIAIGAKEYKPKEYLYQLNPAVMTLLEMDECLRIKEPRVRNAENVVFIQCVGSRDNVHPYCSKVCCTHSIKNALALKNQNPETNVYILYRDIRTYGEREDLYREARQKGVLFFRYDLENKPQVVDGGNLVTVNFHDAILDRSIAVDADLLCLASAIVPRNDLSISRLYKAPVDSDGWLLEAHQKLRPVESATEGVFLCGMSHYPKPIEESIVQAQAAAAKALTVLTKENIVVGGIVSYIVPELCSGCLGCIDVCPFGAIAFNEEKGIVAVNQALCKGCGACAAACPSEAPMLMGFNNKQIYAQINTALCA
jgi:heterodisulfide reductase subunit A